MVIRLFHWLDAEQRADFGEVRFADTAGQQAVMADAMEPIGQDMDQEAADELGCGKAHDLLAIAIFDAIILPTESYSVGIRADQAMVRDRYPVGIAAQIGKHGLWAAKGRFGIDHPFGFTEWGEPGGKGIRPDQPLQVAIESQLSGLVQRHQAVQKEAAEQAGQHAHMQEEPGLAGDPPGAVPRQTAAGHDHMDMRMVCHGRAPSVQDAGQPHLRTHAFGVGGSGHDRFRRRFEQQRVDRPLVPIGDLRDLGGQREHDVEIFHGKQVLGAGLNPVSRRRPLTLRAMAVLATVVGDVMVAALGATGHMPAERVGPAGFYR